MAVRELENNWFVVTASCRKYGVSTSKCPTFKERDSWEQVCPAHFVCYSRVPKNESLELEERGQHRGDNV